MIDDRLDPSCFSLWAVDKKKPLLGNGGLARYRVVLLENTLIRMRRQVPLVKLLLKVRLALRNKAVVMRIAPLFIVSNIASFATGCYLALPPPRDIQQYVIMERSTDFDAGIAEFTKEQLVWVPGSIIFNGCLFAQEAIKFNYREHVIGFDPCHPERSDIKLSDDFRDLSMTMAATVDGKATSFDVSLQHYPPATGEQGYRVLALRQR